LTGRVFEGSDVLLKQCAGLGFGRFDDVVGTGRRLFDPGAGSLQRGSLALERGAECG
jgi:hypothetical protein